MNAAITRINAVRYWHPAEEVIIVSEQIAYELCVHKPIGVSMMFL